MTITPRRGRHAGALCGCAARTLLDTRSFTACRAASCGVGPRSRRGVMAAVAAADGGRNDAAAAGKFTAEIKAFVASGEQEKAFPLMPIDSMVFGSAPHVNASTSDSRC